jgi:hypothetical protein
MIGAGRVQHQDRTPLIDSSFLGLHAGELVEVRSPPEILATLDADGRLEALPFMPEMLEFCGQRFRVSQRATKCCDTIGWTGIHRMERAVHLEGVRCGGETHGGCQARCLIYWKEAWLRRVSDRSVSGPGKLIGGATRCTIEGLTRAARVRAEATGNDEGEFFSCQTTELMRAAPKRIPWWHPRQYAEDVRYGNVSPSTMARSLALMLFNKFQKANRRFLPSFRLIFGARDYPHIQGSLSATPRANHSLRPGELVEIKSRQEIVATLDGNNRNRGLAFESEMSRHCGTRTRVLERVERIIDEKTGKMINLSSDCLILDGVTCSGFYRYLCPRATHSFWREIWLHRVSGPDPQKVDG